MAAFPVEKLSPLPGKLSGEKGNASIAVPMRPFNLLVEGRDESVSTSLRLDFIDLPLTDFVELAGRTFDFPKNPEDGYIDGSIYIYHAHHLADVTRIKFGSISMEGIAVEMDVELLFEIEGLGDYRNTHLILATALRHG
ncbi:MAG: hypothetical protein ABL864_07770 [Terricaulis sp.]